MPRKRIVVPIAVATLIALGLAIDIRVHRKSMTAMRGGEARTESPQTFSSASSVATSAPISPNGSSATPAVPSRLARNAAAVPTPSPSPVPPDEQAMLEIDKVKLMIRDYRTIAGENPVGTNAEIMAAVTGKNPKHAKLGPPEGLQLNEKGELIDRWGTPYFFHQISHDQMEIRSAGPDRIMWTEDDPVTR